MDPVSLAASIITLAEASRTVIQVARKQTRDYRKVESDLAKYHDNLKRCDAVVCQVLEICNQSVQSNTSDEKADLLITNSSTPSFESLSKLLESLSTGVIAITEFLATYEGDGTSWEIKVKKLRLSLKRDKVKKQFSLLTKIRVELATEVNILTWGAADATQRATAQLRLDVGTNQADTLARLYEIQQQLQCIDARNAEYFLQYQHQWTLGINSVGEDDEEHLQRSLLQDCRNSSPEEDNAFNLALTEVTDGFSNTACGLATPQLLGSTEDAFHANAELDVPASKAVEKDESDEQAKRCDCSCHSPLIDVRTKGTSWGQSRLHLVTTWQCCRGKCGIPSLAVLTILYRAPSWLNHYVLGGTIKISADYHLQFLRPGYLPRGSIAVAFARTGQHRALRRLISERKVTPYDLDEAGTSLLMWAVLSFERASASAHVKTIKYLLQISGGIENTWPDATGRTA